MSDSILPSLPEPRPGTPYLAPPAPDPPTEGWWLDPEDSGLLRYHDGTKWTMHVGRSTAPRPEMPGYQGIFALGAGPGGIPTGAPLAPGTGRYLSVLQIWGLVGIIVLGLLVFGVGGNLNGAVGIAVSLLGGALFVGPAGFAMVAAWRAGYRPPGFGPGPKAKGFHIGHLWVAAMVTAAFLIAAQLLPPRSLAYDWVNRIGILMSLGLVLGYLVVAIRIAVKHPPPEHLRHGNKLLVGLALFIVFNLFVRAWGRILDALWLR